MISWRGRDVGGCSTLKKLPWRLVEQGRPTCLCSDIDEVTRERYGVKGLFHRMLGTAPSLDQANGPMAARLMLRTSRPLQQWSSHLLEQPADRQDVQIMGEFPRFTRKLSYTATLTEAPDEEQPGHHHPLPQAIFPRQRASPQSAEAILRYGL